MLVVITMHHYDHRRVGPSKDDTQLLLDRFVDMFLGLASPNSRIVDAPTPLRATSGKVMKKGGWGNLFCTYLFGGWMVGIDLLRNCDKWFMVHIEQKG